MNPRKRMYESNAKARHYLLQEEKCSDVWFKRHTRRKDKIFTQTGSYMATDLFNLFDGIAVNDKGVIYFQVKTNAWPKTEPLNDFCKKTQERIIALNVTKKEIKKREYPYTNRVGYLGR